MKPQRDISAATVDAGADEARAPTHRGGRPATPPAPFTVDRSSCTVAPPGVAPVVYRDLLATLGGHAVALLQTYLQEQERLAVATNPGYSSDPGPVETAVRVQAEMAEFMAFTVRLGGAALDKVIRAEAAAAGREPPPRGGLTNEYADPRFSFDLQYLGFLLLTLRRDLLRAEEGLDQDQRARVNVMLPPLIGNFGSVQLRTRLVELTEFFGSFLDLLPHAAGCEVRPAAAADAAAAPADAADADDEGPVSGEDARLSEAAVDLRINPSPTDLRADPATDDA